MPLAGFNLYQAMIYINPDEMFIRRIQCHLLVHSVAGWQRRGKTLLDINCGDGRFLKKLWHIGFDVSATEASKNLRLAAGKSLGARAEIVAAEDNDLPYENNYFDWAVLHIQSTDPQRLVESISEAIRVAELGLAVTFWNTTAPALFFNKNPETKRKSLGWYAVWNTLRNLHQGSLTTRSTLLCAFAPLRHIFPRFYFKSWQTKLPIGAWTIIRLDLSARHTVTPLLLRTNIHKINNLEPIMECQLPNTKDYINNTSK